MINEDGTGSGWKQKVDERNFAHVFGITETELEDSTRQGLGFNINSGIIAISSGSATRTGILYFKNDEDNSVIVDAAIGWVGNVTATITDPPLFYLVRNPTAGTTITNAVAPFASGANSNFGSNNAFKTSTLTYAGADGDGAFTGGDEYAILGGKAETRSAYSQLNIEIPRGSSLGVEVDLNTSGAANVYFALITHERDPKLG